MVVFPGHYKFMLESIKHFIDALTAPTISFTLLTILMPFLFPPTDWFDKKSRQLRFHKVWTNKGAYVISDCDLNPEIVIFATGSEVHLALEAKENLDEYQIRVINVPCWELFNKQSAEYIDSLLKYNDALLVSIEAGITDGWQKFTGRFGLNIGIDTFGESGPGFEVANHFGITTESIVKRIKDRLSLKVLSD